MRLDYVLALKIEDFLERRLQTQVFKSGLAKSIHHARVLIRQRHIRCVDLQSIRILSANSTGFDLVLASKSSTSHLSSFVSTLKSTLTLPLHHHMVEDALVALSASVPLLLPRRRRVVMMRTKSKLIVLALLCCIVCHQLTCYYDARAYSNHSPSNWNLSYVLRFLEHLRCGGRTDGNVHSEVVLSRASTNLGFEYR